MKHPGIYTENYKVTAGDVDFEDKWKIQSLLSAAQETANRQCVLLGAGRNEMKNVHGAAFILARTYLKMYKYPKSSEEVTISTWPKQGARHILTRFFKIEDSEGKAVGDIVSHWAVINLSERKLISPMSIGFQMPFTGDVPDLLEMPKRQSYREFNQKTVEIEAKYSDIDTLGHVNNTKYAEWMINSLGCDFMRNNTVTEFDIRYSHEVKEKDLILLDISSCEEEPGKIFFKGDFASTHITAFEAWIKTADAVQ